MIASISILLMSIYSALMFLLLTLITFREIFSRLFWYFYFITFIRYIHVRIVILSTLNRLYPQGKTFGLIVSKRVLEKIWRDSFAEDFRKFPGNCHGRLAKIAWPPSLFFSIPICCKDFNTKCLLPHNSRMWNSLPEECFLFNSGSIFFKLAGIRHLSVRFN